MNGFRSAFVFHLKNNRRAPGAQKAWRQGRAWFDRLEIASGVALGDDQRQLSSGEVIRILETVRTLKAEASTDFQQADDLVQLLEGCVEKMKPVLYCTDLDDR